VDVGNGPWKGGQNVMRNSMALGVLVGLLLVVAGCNPFLDRFTHIRGEFPMLSLIRIDSSIPMH
jgi:hypothetical protein